MRQTKAPIRSAGALVLNYAPSVRAMDGRGICQTAIDDGSGTASCAKRASASPIPCDVRRIRIAAHRAIADAWYLGMPLVTIRLSRCCRLLSASSELGLCNSTAD